MSGRGLSDSVLPCSFGGGATTISIQALAAEETHAMEEINHVARSSPSQERKHRRFSLQYPVRLKVHSADSMVELDAVSRNISIGGLLLETSSMIPQHTPVSFIVTVRSALVVRPIQFVGEGKVVRVDAKAAEEGFAIAVECKRPITRTDDPLAATGS
jgi:PilZ domain